MRKTIAQAQEKAFKITCDPELHADYGIALVNRIQECYDRVWDHKQNSIPASMAVALVRALTPHWRNAPEYQLTITEHLLQDDLNAVTKIENLLLINSFGLKIFIGTEMIRKNRKKLNIICKNSIIFA